MSHKSQKAAEAPAQTAEEHEDDLIVVPKGQSRLRYLATIALVLFLLVIFVVADLFQSSMTGGGGTTDETYLTWEDPVSGDVSQVKESDFMQTARLLSMLSNLGVYYPDSLLYGEIDPSRRTRPDPTDEDVASFLVFEDMALDEGIAISNEEHIDRLRAVFGDAQGLSTAASMMRMPVAQLEDSVRRVLRVSKLKALLMGAAFVPDADEIVARWQEEHPRYKFQVVTTKRDDYIDQARTEAPADEELLEWFHGRPPFEQQRLFTEAKVVPEVAYVSLAEDADFDPTALLEAYPSPDGIDLDEQARNYHRQVRAARFRVPPDEQNADSPDDDEDSEEGEQDETPTKLFYEFEDVEEQVRREAPIHAALGAFLTDLQDRMDAGEEIDLAAEAERLGFKHEAGPEEGYGRTEITEIEAWGTPDIAGQLLFGQPGSIVPRVIVGEKAMTVGRIVSKIDREEPPFEEIREDVVELWAKERAKELAVESLDTMRAVLAEKPEDVEAADWRPLVDAAEFEKLAREANYGFYERPWLERNEQPSGAGVEVQTVDRIVPSRAELFELEAGQVAAPVASFDGSEAYLFRLEGEQQPEPGEIDAATLLQMRNQSRADERRDFGAKVFTGDSVWLTERAKIAFPAREAREAEEAESEGAEGPEGTE